MKISFLTYFPLLFLFASATTSLIGQSTVANFSLKNVDGNTLNVATFNSQKAIVVIFTSNYCIYSKKYETRIKKLFDDYSSKGVQLILINSNSPQLSEEDSFENMKLHASEKGYKFPYLQDDNDHTVAKMFGATKNPEVFVMIPKDGNFKIVYSGPIDDNALVEGNVTVKYVATILDQLTSNKTIDVTSKETTGCGIKGIN